MVLTPEPPLFENTATTLRCVPPPCLRARSAITRSTAALSAERSSGRRSTSCAPARMARSSISGSKISVEKKIAASGCSRR
jgi:hypothetical protein